MAPGRQNYKLHWRILTFIVILFLLAARIILVGHLFLY